MTSSIMFAAVFLGTPLLCCVLGGRDDLLAGVCEFPPRTEGFLGGGGSQSPFCLSSSLKNFFWGIASGSPLWYNARRFTPHGESSSIGRASDCDSEGCGIVPRLLPHKQPASLKDVGFCLPKFRRYGGLTLDLKLGNLYNTRQFFQRTDLKETRRKKEYGQNAQIRQCEGFRVG